MLKRSITLLSCVFFVLWSASCSRKTAVEPRADYEGPMISYASAVAPLIERSCSPCHYPQQEGKKVPLDSYIALKREIGEVIARVQLPDEDVKFMPFKHKRESLTAEEIEMLKNWARGGFPE
jgi:hypothetical protein